MSSDLLVIPKKLKVGFQERSDTYSKKLGFVVYIKDDGKLSKEKSWNGWVSKDIPAEEFDNAPTSGFVLNKDVGGAQRSYSWNARREKARVYDPRNFEIEISMENLLFILQECSSVKGKGLDGEFVYAWGGTELVLMPVCSKEYKSSVMFTSLKKENVKKKDIIEGHIYTFKDTKSVMYLGKHKCNSFNTWDTKTKNKHVFIDLSVGAEEKYIFENDTKKLARKTSEEVSGSYADEYELFKNSNNCSTPKCLKLIEDTEPPKYEWMSNRTYVEYENQICYVNKMRNYKGGNYENSCLEWRVERIISLEGGEVRFYHSIYYNSSEKYLPLDFVTKRYKLVVEMENGSTYEYED